MDGNGVQVKCSGVSVSGYWKGYPCGNDGKFEHGGKMYCASHYSIAIYDPSRFERAIARLIRKHSE